MSELLLDVLAGITGVALGAAVLVALMRGKK